MVAFSEQLSGIDSGCYAPSADESLDPADWPQFRAQAHRMLDDILDYTQDIRDRPVWQPCPYVFQEPLPSGATDLADVHQRFLREIVPYTAGNVHPGFMGWVHGGGTPVGMLAEMLAAGLNSNLAGRNQAPVAIERQIVQWAREIFGFPETASGLFVTGTSMANLIGLLVARTAALGVGVRGQGIADQKLVAYASRGAHGSIAQSMDLAGLGTAQLRLIAVNDRHEMDVRALEQAIVQDRQRGLTPFFVVGCAGTVDVGAIDSLAAISEVAHGHQLWFHVDGAYGALAMLAPALAPRLRGIESADSIAFDFHKWGQVPYDAGFVLVRDGKMHAATFASAAAYLSRETRGLAAGSTWPCDLGPDQSRSFRALKTWFTLQVYGAKRLGEVISNTCALAQYLAHRVELEPLLELLAPVALNIVCFRYRCHNADEVNRSIVADLQESGIAAPSTTTVNGCVAIRAAIVNHRTSEHEVDAMLAAILRFADKYVHA